ncbi:universal stress protein, partial [Paracoccus liaowanqingii]
RTLGAAGLTADTRIAPGEPEDVLQSVVAAEGFGLLVMGAYGHSRIRSLIIGSTTTAMVQAVRIPVLMYR